MLPSSLAMTSPLRLTLLGLVLICCACSPSSSAAEPEPLGVLPLLEGGELDLDQLRGQVLLLDFWASWCTPCRLSLPALQTLGAELAGQAVTIVPISVDQDEVAARRFRDRFAPGLASAIDPTARLATRFDLAGMPASILLDAQGRIAHRHTGFRRGDEAIWREQLRALVPVNGP